MKRHAPLMAAAALAFAMGMASCDDTYDLKKDIDLTVGIGGDHLTIPSSNTQFYPLSQILNLDENSTVKADDAGNYSLCQTGNETDTHVDIGFIELDDDIVSNDMVTAQFPTVPNAGVGSISFVLGGTSDSGFNIKTDKLTNNISINSSDKVPADIKSIDEVYADMIFNIHVGFSPTNYKGSYTFNKGFTIAFDPTVTVAVNADYLTVEDGYKVVFTKDKTVASGKALDLQISIVRAKVPNGQGIINGKFNYHSGIVSTGKITLDAKSLTAGTAPKIDARIDTNIAKGSKVTGVVGMVDPDVDIDDVDFKITDVPKYLTDQGTVIDVVNPQIYFDVLNSSPCDVDFEAVLTPYKDGAATSKPVTISTTILAGNNKICVAVKNPGTDARFVEVKDLGSLLRTIPDQISLHVKKAKVVQKQCYFKLGKPGYDFKTKCEVRVPLMFGADTRIAYSDSETGWNEDDLNKTNFSIVTITADVVNTIPLTFTPEVSPIFKDGRQHNVTVDLGECIIAPGSLESPATTSVKIVIKALPKDNLGSLDGIDYKFIGSNPLDNCCLNAKQGLKFNNVLITVSNVVYDLNKDSNELVYPE